MPQAMIIGAGVTGLTLAIELLRRGVAVRIVDIAEQYFGGSRGKGIQPRTLELLDMAGLFGALPLDADPVRAVRRADRFLGHLRLVAPELARREVSQDPCPEMGIAAARE